MWSVGDLLALPSSQLEALLALNAIMPRAFGSYGVSHDLVHLSSNLVPQVVSDKAQAPTDSNTGSETEKLDHLQLRGVCSSISDSLKEQKPPSQPAQPLASHDLNRQPAHEPVSWAERLCHTNFFSPCARHSSKVYRRCECTHFCMDCKDSGALCSCCLSDHMNCKTLQIRRYVYRDVVKVGDIQQYIDTSGIQTYTVNHAQAIFLSAKDKALVGPYYRVDSSSSCVTCHRGLRNGCSYCSLACKLAATEGITPPEPMKEQRTRAVKPVKPSKPSSRSGRCTPTGDEDSSAPAEEVFQPLVGSAAASGATTPTEGTPYESHGTSGSGSMECPLSSAVSQALERGKKRAAPGPGGIKKQASLTGSVSRRKQARPMRASE